MKEIRKRDDFRRADVTIFLNDDDDVIGMRFEPFRPIRLVDFNLDRLLVPIMRMRPTGFPSSQGIGTNQTKEST